jgi:hypothetical protein
MLTNLAGARKQMMSMQLYLNHPDYFNEYYKQPLEFFPEFVELQTLARRVRLIKHLITLKPSAFTFLYRKLTKKSPEFLSQSHPDFHHKPY